MSTLMLTLIISFVFIGIAFFLLSIGYLLTGRPGFQLRSCGRDPTKERKNSEGCDTSGVCSVCGKSDREEKPIEKREEEQE